MVPELLRAECLNPRLGEFFFRFLLSQAPIATRAARFCN